MIRPGPLEIGLVLVIILIVFGVGKLPQVGAAFGKGIRAFKKGQSGEDEEEEKPKKKTKKKKKKVVKKVAEEKTEEKTEEKAEVKAEGKTEEKV
ncbi:MAG: twin-arginine translocase TatA/TatE family subunit [Gammaproteobacteria bacterium]|nr:twin-arginine translocase TatA/TatE family subunit [Gammaproteobacteria bacterium]